MAGGGGTRFWPLSRQKTPKQLLNLSGKDLMVNETIDRLAMTVPGKNMFIVTNASQVESMKKATTGRVLPNHILSEPSARNTAACIGYAAMGIIKKYGDLKILRQIFQHVTAARRTAAVQQQGRNFTVKSCNLRIKLFLVISFIGHNVSSNLLVSFNPFYYSLSAAGMQAAYDIL